MDYSKLTKLYLQLESTSKRLEKTFIISEFIKNIKKTDVDHLIYLIQGKVFPPWDNRVIGVSSKIIIKALDVSTGTPKKEIEQMWADIGDLGEVAKELVGKSKQSTLFTKKLTTRKVFENIQKLSTLVGEGTVGRKIGLMAELLTSASADEARFVVRTILEDMRIGVAAGTLRDSITQAFFGKQLGVEYDAKKNDLIINDREEYTNYVAKVQGAYDLLTDFGKVVSILLEKGEKGLSEIGLEVGRPVNVMLYPKAQNVEEAFNVVGKPCAIEFKYDGWRALIHIQGKEIKIFTRNLENVAKQFPDVIKNIRDNVKAKDCILDSEVIGYDPETKKWLPFQAISQRIRRKHRIEELAKKIPVMVQVFDVLEYDGTNMLKKPFKERRKLIEKIIKVEENKVHLAEQIITDDSKEAHKFYEASLKAGNEGVMFKNLEGVYKPGARVGYGIKLKPTLDRLDLTIVGAEWGTGKRANWLSSFTLACVDSDGKFVELGNVGTGIKEKKSEDVDSVTFGEITEILRNLIIKDHGKYVQVKPKVVVEIDYEEIQKSTNYSSGYALRFPRVVRLRYGDKNAEDSTSLVEIEKIYQKQRGRDI